MWPTNRWSRSVLDGSRLARASVAAAAVVGLLLLATNPALANCADPVTCPDDAPGAALLLVLANTERAKAGLPLLVPRTDVTEIAAAHSRRMAERGEIWHNDEYFSPATKERLSAKARGENVASSVDVADAHARLMDSPLHRANILDPRFTVAGFAVVRASGGQSYITQAFLEPKATIVSALVAPKPAPAPTPAPAHAPAPPAPRPAPAAPPTTTAPPSSPAPAVAPEPTPPAKSDASPADPSVQMLAAGELALAPLSPVPAPRRDDRSVVPAIVVAVAALAVVGDQLRRLCFGLPEVALLRSVSR